MTCAKKRVKCWIVVSKISGYHQFEGTNDVQNAQEACPRTEGEGYEKCRTICKQPAHAELIALKKALESGVDLHDATAYIEGIDHCCKNCQRQMYAAGIRTIKFIEGEAHDKGNKRDN
jgi:deoxycytidylate deaminase